MFYWYSKMWDKAKSKDVQTVETLLRLFVQNSAFQRDGGFKARALIRADGETEFRIQADRHKHTLNVWPRLDPSRKLLHAKPQKERKSVLLLCPHLPEPLAADFRLAGINHADLNGRLFIKSSSFLLDREPRGNVYRNPGTELNPFSLKSSRVVRTLLSHRRREWTQADLETRTGISRPLVSLTLAELVERELVEQTRPGGRHVAALYRVRDFSRALEAWSAADHWSKRTTIQEYSVLARNTVEIAEIARNALGADNLFFTQWFAAHLRQPYTTPPLVSAYLRTKSPPEVAWARLVDNGGNLWLITPKDEGVFQETQRAGGFDLVSDIQIYLDLLQVGQRGPEQAQALRDWEGFAN